MTSYRVMTGPTWISPSVTSTPEFGEDAQEVLGVLPVFLFAGIDIEFDRFAQQRKGGELVVFVAAGEEGAPGLLRFPRV